MLLIVLGAANSNGMRGVLLALLVVAILLIAMGAGIAVLTFYKGSHKG